MKILQINKILLKTMGLLPTKLDEIVPFSTFLLILYSIGFLMIFGPSAAFLWANLSDLEKVSDALYACFSYFIIITMLWILTGHKDELKTFVDDLESLAEERIIKNLQIYKSSEENIMIFAKIYLTFTYSFVIMIVLLPFAVVFYHLLAGTYNFDVWFLLYGIVLPIEIDTATKHALFSLQQSLTSLVGTTTVCTVVSLYVSVTFYTEAFLNDITSVFDKMDKLQREENLEFLYKRHLVEAVTLHSKLLELLRTYGKMMSGVLFTTIVPCILSLCGSLFRLHATSETLNILSLSEAMASVTFVIELLFLFCYFGNRVTIKLSDLSDNIYSKHWYKYPKNIQMNLVLVLMRAQVPFYFKGWHLMPCTLNNFVAVVKSSVSAYMLLRNIDR